ncbi:hypothetical protein Tsubulata_005813 [Turnera subulata]|uniref:DUF7356 domain-containing protein n=1 Tax=Turnera subulata TaxID=218843 RepID=A0A9Q0GJJ0_9ROSI|nr:hypothetical protein Tsubulata_005813 [Turnera subulata]
METNRAIIVGLALLLLLAVVGGALAGSNKIGSETAGLDSQLNNTNSAKEQAAGSNIGSKSSEDSKESTGKVDQVSKSKEGGVDDVNKDNSTTGTGSKETVNTEKHNKEINNKPNGGSSVESQVKEDGQNGKENSSGGSKPTDKPKEKTSGGDSDVPVAKPKKEGPRAEECGPSNKCTDKEKKLVACLRVPGNDSPDLSLLIQNKGKTPLSVTIAAPDFVQLEEAKIVLQEKENRRVKVSFTKGGKESLIVLQAGNGRCELDIRDLISHNFGDSFDNSHKSSYMNFMTRKSVIAFLCFVALLTLVSGWMFFSFRRKQVSSSVLKYQRLDMELPVSGGRKAELEVNDGWEDSWGDDWDDEEAPKTPSMPVTPSLSSKGLASRRLNKEGWKD